MPWLTLTFSGKPTNSKYQTLATISHLTRITREERRSISAFIKNAWKRAEILRSQLNELVSEFVHADTDKRRMNVYTRYTDLASWHHHQTMINLKKFSHNFSQYLPEGHSISSKKHCNDLWKTRMSQFFTTVGGLWKKQLRLVLQCHHRTAVPLLRNLRTERQPRLKISWKKEKQLYLTAPFELNLIAKRASTWAQWTA